MSCNCQNNTCLELAPRVVQCGENIVTLLLPDETGTWLMSYEFNNRWFGVEIPVTQNTLVEVPAVFNEQYNHSIKFYKTDGTLFNDTCYVLDTSLIMGTFGSFIPASPSDSDFNYANVQGQDSNVIPFAAGTPIVVMDGTQAYIQGQFTWDGMQITMTGGQFFYLGQPLTILYV